jgi:hypothetical protein
MARDNRTRWFSSSASSSGATADSRAKPSGLNTPSGRPIGNPISRDRAEPRTRPGLIANPKQAAQQQQSVEKVRCGTSRFPIGPVLEILHHPDSETNYQDPDTIKLSRPRGTGGDRPLTDRARDARLLDPARTLREGEDVAVLDAWQRLNTAHPREIARRSRSDGEAERSSIDWLGKLRAAYDENAEAGASYNHFLDVAQRARAVVAETADRLRGLGANQALHDREQAALFAAAVEAGSTPKLAAPNNGTLAAAIEAARNEATIATN